MPYTGPDGSEGADLYLDRNAFRETFAADVDPDTAAVMAAAQRPYAAAAFAGTPSSPPAWKTLDFLHVATRGLRCLAWRAPTRSRASM